MSGSIKVGGHNVFVHTGASGAGTLSVQGQNGNVLLSDDGTAVSLGNNVRLPASGGIKDSSGNNVLSEANNVVSIDSGVQFPAGHLINYKFVEIGGSYHNGSYTPLNHETAATSTQGFQIITTSFTPKSTNSKIFCQAQLFVQEALNNNDFVKAALFVETTNISQQLNNDRADGSYYEQVVATLAGQYTNSSTTAKTIQIRASSGDNNPIDINIYNRSAARQTNRYITTGLSIFEIQQ